MTDPTYDAIRILTGPDFDQSISLSAGMRQARDAASHQRYVEAHELILNAAEQVRDLGLAELSLDLLRELETLVPQDSVEPQDRAWLFNAIGLSLVGMGKPSEATPTFESMREIGERIDDRHIVTTALHNLGTVAHADGRLAEARELYLSSLREKLTIEEYWGATQLLLNLSSVAQEMGQLSEAEELLASVEIVLRFVRDPHLLAALHGNVGLLAIAREEFTRAERHFRNALRWARRTDDLVVQVRTLQNLGAVNVEQGRVTNGVRWYRRALEQAAKIGGPPSLIEPIHRGLGLAFHRQGRNDQAMVHFESAREAARQMGDDQLWASATADLGALTLMVGETDRATELLRETQPVFRQLGDHEWQVRVLANLAEASKIAGNIEEAGQLIEQAVQLLPRESHGERADLLRRAGEFWLATPLHLDLATSYFERSLSERQDRDEPSTVAWQSALAAAALSEHGGASLSLPFYDRALQLYERIGDEQMAFHTRNDRAIALTDLERFDDARREYATCLELADRLEDRVMELQASTNLGEMARQEGNTEEALRLLRRAVVLSRELSDVHSEADALGNLGIALANVEEWADAAASFRVALDLGRRSGEIGAQATAVGGLAGIEFARGRHGTAARLYRRATNLWRRIGDHTHLLEDLAGLIESVAALGRSAEMQTLAQSLVDTAQEFGANEFASRSLARAARWWLGRRQLDEAGDLYAASIVLAGVTPNADEQDMLQSISVALMLTVTHARLELATDQEEAFYSSLTDSLNEHYEGIGNQLQGLLRLAREVGSDLEDDSPDGTSR